MRDTTDSQGFAATAAGCMRSSALPGFADPELKVRDVMADTVVCATPSETVLAAIKKMSEHRVSCVVIVKDDRVVGILTERDVLRGVAAESRDSTRSRVAERMSSPVVSVDPDAPVLDASELMRARGVRRLVVGDGIHLLGLVTQTDITRGLTSQRLSRNVGDIMSTNVVTVNASATVAEAARLMTSRNISCVVVMNRDEPAGILTEKDVLKRVVALHRDPSTTPVQDVMSHPLVSSSPDHSILCVSRTMDRMRIHRLVVKENKQVCGIISQTDILDALRKELEELRAAQALHQSKLNRLVDSTARNLSSIESLAGETRRTPELAASTAARENASCDICASADCECCPPTPEDPSQTSLQNLISESRTNLERISKMLRGRSVD